MVATTTAPRTKTAPNSGPPGASPQDFGGKNVFRDKPFGLFLEQQLAKIPSDSNWVLSLFDLEP